MKTRLTWLLVLMMALTAFWGCSDDDDSPVIPTETAFEAMAAAGAAYINDSADCPGVVNAEAVQALVENDQCIVVDIRSATAFADGHIPGAYNVAMSELPTALAAGDIPSDKTIVITCYSGQSAGYAKVALEMLGYEDVKTLAFGMSSWNSGNDRDKWTSKCADGLDSGDLDVTNNNTGLTEHSFPTLSENVSSVVADRVQHILDEGLKAVSYNSISANLDDYFIVNYFGETDYMPGGANGVPGHIAGAFQYTPYASLGIDEMLENLPTDLPIVVYCWTGQHSAQVVAYLNMLGYDAYSLANGSNTLFHSSLPASKAWNVEDDCYEFDVDMGASADPAFTEIASVLGDYINGSTVPGVVAASAIWDEGNGTLNGDYTVIDVRSVELYNISHIPGAYQCDLEDLATAVGTTIPTDKTFAVVCKTGQTAGFAKVALELMGYSAVSVGFGMSSWNSDLDLWTSHCADELDTPDLVNHNEDLAWNSSYPDLNGETVESRVNALLAGGFKGVGYTTIENDLDDYFIINYFSESDYMPGGSNNVPGHIEGAFQFTPKASLGLGQMLNYLPTDMPIVVYCWTGQHSSQVTAYLRMLGYDAYSLTFGSNNLFHSNLPAGKAWNVMDDCFEYPLEVPAFAAN